MKNSIWVRKGKKERGKLEAEGSKLKAEGPDELKDESSKFENDKVWWRA